MKSITLMQKTVLTITIIFVVIQSAFSQFTSKKSQSTKTKPIPQIQKQEPGSPFKVDSNGRIPQAEVTKMLELRLRNFAGCLELLVNKKVNPQEVKDNYAMRLFANNENVFVQEKNKKDVKPKTYKIRDYLNRIATLKYEYITVQWADLTCESPLRWGKDSVVHGTYSSVQTFYGFNKDGGVYVDKVKKHINFRINIEPDTSNTRFRRFKLYVEDIID